MNTPVIEAPPVRLRAVTIEDVDGPYVTWLQDSEVLRFLEARFATHTRDSLARFVTESVDNPDIFFWAIEIIDEPRHVGNIKLGPVNWNHSRGEIGVMIGDRTAWGRGVATAAIAAVAHFAFDRLRIHKLTAGCYSQNIGSLTAFQRAGFHVEARLAEHWIVDGQRNDGVLLARFRPG